MTRRGYIHDELKLILFWSPKCACTTLFATLVENFGRNRKFYLQNSQDWRHCLQLIKSHGYNSVVIARSPTARTVSAYLNKFVLRDNEYLYNTDMLIGSSKKLYEQYLILSGKKVTNIENLENEMTFEDFLKTVENLHNKRVDVNDNSIDSHWDTQVPPAMVSNGFRYDRIVRVENLNNDLKKLCDEYGLIFTPRTSNQTPGLGCVDNVEYLGAMSPKFLAKNTLSHSSFLSSQAMDIIKNIYWPDFNMFGYPLS